MNTTHCKRESQNRYPHWNHFLAALFVVAMVMISPVPACAVEATASTNTPDTEVSISKPDLVEKPADEDGAYPDETGGSEPAPTTEPVSTIEELLEAIAQANENDVIEFDGFIQAPSSELVLGRADCPVTIRRATSEAYIVLWNQGEGGGSTKVQNITFDGAGIQAQNPILKIEGPMNIIEKCNFVNCIAAGSSALEISYGDVAFVSDCHFVNNKGFMGAHLRVGKHKTTIENCTFTGGSASDTGSIYIGITQKTVLTGCTISGNTAGVQGGGIYIEEGELSIAGCKIHGNTANGVADDITKGYWSYLSMADDYAALVELYKSDGLTPNRWTVDSRIDVYRGMAPDRADMVFSMTFADNEPEPVPTPLPTSITLDKSELTLDVGETDTLTASLHPEGTSSSVQWTSSNPSVASVSENGFITAHSTGITLITATAAVGRMSASCRVNVQDVPATTYSIDISASPTEGGIVSGVGQYEEGALVTVTAVSSESFRFLMWTEADTQVSTESSLTFTVTNDRMLTAVFEPIPGPIPKPAHTINTSATVGGTVSGAGNYEHGKPVTLTATPENGYLFAGWTEDGEQVSTEARYTFTAEGNRTIVAVFELIPQSPPDLTHEPSQRPGTPSTLHSPGGGNAQPVVVSTASSKEVQISTLTNGKAVLVVPNDSFWVGYKTGRGNGAETVTRADLAQLVYFMMDSKSAKTYGATKSSFRDVEPGVWYEAAVGTMSNTGIMVGCGDNLFCPDCTLTWGELLTVFTCFAKDKPITERYTGKHWAKNAVNRAFTLGWLEYSEAFDPGGIVTTDEMIELIQAVFRWNNEQDFSILGRNSLSFPPNKAVCSAIGNNIRG